MLTHISVHLVFCANPFGHLHITTQMCSIWRWFQVLSGQFLFIGVEILFITRGIPSFNSLGISQGRHIFSVCFIWQKKKFIDVHGVLPDTGNDCDDGSCIYDTS